MKRVNPTRQRAHFIEKAHRELSAGPLGLRLTNSQLRAMAKTMVIREISRIRESHANRNWRSAA